MYEYERTIPTLWTHVRGIVIFPTRLRWRRLIHRPGPEFIEKYPQYVSKDNAMSFLSSDKGKSYNLCHCKQSIRIQRQQDATTDDPRPSPVWSNFEIADMNFWRGEAYTRFFEYLDSQGGFYYEVRRPSVRPSPSPFLFTLELTMDSEPLAVGRRSGAQHRSVAVREKRPDPFLSEYRVRACAVHALSVECGYVAEESVYVQPGEQFW